MTKLTGVLFLKFFFQESQLLEINELEHKICNTFVSLFLYIWFDFLDHMIHDTWDPYVVMVRVLSR